MRTTTLALAACLATAGLVGCNTAQADQQQADLFELEPHPLLPVLDGQFATGTPRGEPLPQPIAFSHYTHAYTLEMNCQYCHSAARRSIHSGVPPTQTCMGCHTHVKKDSPEIVKLTAMWESGAPIAWNKVHDLPDYVYFSHKRHIQGGLDCTECHGQVMMQGEPVLPEADAHEEADDAHGASDETKSKAKAKAHGAAEDHSTADHGGGGGGGEAHAEPEEMTVMVRETTLQMGWCLDCHANHPSIDKNYGKDADLRRAELKDCWTCHK